MIGVGLLLQESVHTEDILSVAYHPHFQVMASSSYDGEVSGWVGVCIGFVSVCPTQVIAWSLVSSRIVARLKSHLSMRDPMSSREHSPPHLLQYHHSLTSSVQGNNVVHKVLFLLKRSKCRESATLVSSGPSGTCTLAHMMSFPYSITLIPPH